MSHASFWAWSRYARQQEVVAISSAESEYISLCNGGVKETIWLRRLLSGIGVVPDMNMPTEVLVENQAVISLAHCYVTLQ